MFSCCLLEAQIFRQCLNCHVEFQQPQTVAAKRQLITQMVNDGRMPPDLVLSASEKKNVLAEVNRLSGTLPRYRPPVRKKKPSKKF